MFYSWSLCGCHFVRISSPISGLTYILFTRNIQDHIIILTAWFWLARNPHAENTSKNLSSERLCPSDRDLAVRPPRRTTSWRPVGKKCLACGYENTQQLRDLEVEVLHPSEPRVLSPQSALLWRGLAGYLVCWCGAQSCCECWALAFMGKCCLFVCLFSLA